MNKKLQVFVSSTYTDLIEERQSTVVAILDAGHIPAGMELFKAGKSQMDTIRKWIDDSDVYMLILGGRYGSIEENSGLSYTELEYEYALSKKMPVFAVVLKDNFLKLKEVQEDQGIIIEKDNILKYNSFKAKVETNIVKYVENVDQIASAIHSQLNDIISDCDYNLTGWIRGDHIVENTDLTTEPNICSGIYPGSLKLRETDIYICPSCFYAHHKIVPVNIRFAGFTCEQCGYSNMN